MSILRATLDSLASMLSVRGDQVEDALASERLVQAGMSRRGFFRGTTAAAAALALPSGLVMAETPGVVLAHRLSLVVNIVAIDAINKKLVMVFDAIVPSLYSNDLFDSDKLGWAYSHNHAAAPAPATTAPPSIHGHAGSDNFR